MSEIVVTAHQLNFLLPVSVIDRIRQADDVIWLDQAQYVRHSYVNRNRFPTAPDPQDWAWMTVPVDEHATFAPINRVKIADPTGRAREKIARTIEMRLGVETAAPFARELRRPYKLLAGLNFALIEALFNALDIQVRHHFQSMLDTAHAIPAVSSDDDDLEPVKERFAEMADQLNADVWLSGPGRHHGDPERFLCHGIRIEYTGKAGANPCALELLRERKAVAA